MRPLTATRTLLALERRFRRHRRAVIPAVVLVGVLAVLAPLSSAGLLWLLKVMIDSVFVARRLDAMPILIGGYFGLASLKFGADYLRRCMDVAVAERINQDVRAEVYRHVMTLSEPSVIGRGIGDLLAHLSGDVREQEGRAFEDRDEDGRVVGVSAVQVRRQLLYTAGDPVGFVAADVRDAAQGRGAIGERTQGRDGRRQLAEVVQVDVDRGDLAAAGQG